ncbi:hypothetical protein JOL62DRAFT_440613 [Phyllosticta paracitricarpa]|uniref:Secreted protein n=1 Tax=Phyllosticta paracitricarpa TaxID=2016321 RepID=A0ABR1NC66_9PEZI
MFLCFLFFSLTAFLGFDFLLIEAFPGMAGGQRACHSEHQFFVLALPHLASSISCRWDKHLVSRHIHESADKSVRGACIGRHFDWGAE